MLDPFGFAAISGGKPIIIAVRVANCPDVGLASCYQAVQPVFRNGEANLLEVPRGIGEAPLIRHAQRLMNIGALMQEVYNVEECGFNRDAIRFHRFG